MQKIYLDHSATTPVDEIVLNKMIPYFSKNYGNASSIHSFGQEASNEVKEARTSVANFLNCEPNEIIFTSGATESNNLALRGLIKDLKHKGVTNPHIITSAIEHDSVLEPAQGLKKEGVDIDFLQVDKKGLLSPNEVISKIKSNTILISIMHINSEVGTVQPIKEIAEEIYKVNQKRDNKAQTVYFHTDATQAINFFNHQEWKKVDLLSFSGHKIYGPKGVGVLYIRKGAPIRAIQSGGHHEFNLRSGTLNVPGIVGLGEAVKMLTKESQEKNNKYISKLRDMLITGIKDNIPGAILNTDKRNSSPSHAHFTFPGVEGESILMMLDLEGIAISTGSACASEKLQASRVLLEMGIPKEVAHGSIRFTIGKNNTEEEMGKVIKTLPPIIEKLNKISPLKNT